MAYISRTKQSRRRVKYLPIAVSLASASTAALIHHESHRHIVELRQNIRTRNRLRLESAQQRVEALLKVLTELRRQDFVRTVGRRVAGWRNV